MKIIRGANRMFSRIVRQTACSNHAITGSLVVPLIILISVLLVGIIS